MKINGVTVLGAYEEVVVFPRITGKIVFKARAVSDYEPFDKLCPQPTPPQIQYAGAAQPIDDVENADFLKKFHEWAELKSHWLVLMSLRATEGLVWDTVNMSDYTTWKNYQTELTASGFTPAEQSRIVQIVSRANGLDQSKIDEATESFLRDQAALAQRASSPVSAPTATPSGEPANA